MSEEGRFTIHLEHLQGYEYKVKFDWDQVPELVLDEPAPLGSQAGPNAARMVAAATANCLSASLLFCIHKAEPPPGSMHTAVTCTMVRNPKQRLRIGGVEVRIQVSGELEQAARMRRCLELFEDFCVVTASLREGIAVAVEVVNPGGEVLHRADG
jgi:organic hydroperoxide reductase OsmC/OhrA